MITPSPQGPCPKRLARALASVPLLRPVGRVVAVREGLVCVEGLPACVSVGDIVALGPRRGEVVAVLHDETQVIFGASGRGIQLGERVEYLGPFQLSPDASWLGRVMDAFARPLDGRPLRMGLQDYDPRAGAPEAADRQRLGGQLMTGLPAMDLFLPLAKGQRLGLFAGSGVGKTTLISQLARAVSCDVVVIALIGERGRELRDFVEDTLGPEGLARSVVVAATSDQSAVMRRQAAFTAMAVAEAFRDQGADVLFLADSLTRLADAHREIAVAAGERCGPNGHPPSMAELIMSFCERAGPGPRGGGSISALFSVLVAGSDMEEPLADHIRGILDGHVILDRTIAERGRYPAVDIPRSLSRSFTRVTTPEEAAPIQEARALLSRYEEARLMIQSGLYEPGASAELDRAVTLYPALDALLATPPETLDRLAALMQLQGILHPDQKVSSPPLGA